MGRVYSQNQKPQYLVFMYHPSGFRRYRGWHDVISSSIEPIEYLLRYRLNMQTAMTLMQHPKEALQFATWAYRSICGAFLKKVLHMGPQYFYADAAAQRAENMGLYTLPLPAETRCGSGYGLTMEDFFYAPAWTNGLRSKYQSRADHVLLNLAPMPDCLPVSSLVESKLGSKHDNAFLILPITMFNNSDNHFTKQGAAVASTQLADQILEIEKRK